MQHSGHHESFAEHAAAPIGSNRSFCLVFAGVFTLVGLGGGLRPWALAVGAAWLLVGLLAPHRAHRLNVLWMRLALLLSRVTNPVITALLFYLVFTPFALFFRLTGRDALRRRRDPAAASYWVPRDPPGPDPAGLTNQF
jgi:hypothetical protein